MSNDTEPKVPEREKTPRIGDLEALKAEVDVTRDNARVVLTTAGGSIQGTLVKMQDGFGIRMENGDYAEFSLRQDSETIMGNVPEGVDKRINLHVRAAKADGTSSEYWSQPLQDFNVIR